MPREDWTLLRERLPRLAPLRHRGGWTHKVQAGSYCKVHSHPALEIVYHRLGHGVTKLGGGGAISYAEGSVVIYAPGEEHDQQMISEGEDVCVHIEIPRSRGAPQRALYVEQIEDPVVVREIETLAENAPPPEMGRFHLASDLRASAVLATLLETAFADLRADLPPAERHVRKAEEFMRRHHREIASIREVARHAGISHDHLRHLFQAQRQKSPVQHLNEVRVARAQSLLGHSQLAIKEIAALCGFRDVYYFSHVFRHIAKCPPARYRERLNRAKDNQLQS